MDVHKQPPPRPQKHRGLGGTSVSNVDKVGLDAVGTSATNAQAAFRPPSPGTSPMGHRPSNSYQRAEIDASALGSSPGLPGRPMGSLRGPPGLTRTNGDDEDCDSVSGESVFSRSYQPRYSESHNLPLPDDMRTPSGTPVTGTSVTASESTRRESQRHDIIYRLELNDLKSRGPPTFRYSTEPFQGLDPIDTPTRRELAVMDLSSSITGYWLRQRGNQLRDEFLKEKNPEPFIIGKDFVARSHTFYHIRVHSSRVLDVLRSLITYYPTLGLSLQEPEVFFMYPYRVLFYYYDELQEALDTCSENLQKDDARIDFVPGSQTTRLNRETHKDLSVVLGYLKPFYHKEIEPERLLHAQGLAKFSSLWMLYRPGSTVFANVKGQLHFFKVLSANREVDTVGESSGPWSITVWGLYFDGYLLKRQARRFKIPEYHGSRDIQKLPVKPKEFLPGTEKERNSLIERLVERGKKYYKFVCEVPLYKRYSGPVNGDRGDHYVGDVIIDPAGFAKEEESAKQMPSNFQVMFGARGPEEDFGTVLPGDPPDFGGGHYSKLNDRRCEKGTQLEAEDECLLIPGHIQGYALGRKQWLAFDMDSFDILGDADKPWKNLVINPTDLQLVKSLAGKHRDSKIIPWTADFIPGKGQGQVVLLHGPPGVGEYYLYWRSALL
jgi:hypothetical protein